MKVVCTGDWVAVDLGGDPRCVRAYLPRRTSFVRSTAVELDLGRVECFLTLARESGRT